MMVRSTESPMNSTRVSGGVSGQLPAARKSTLNKTIMCNQGRCVTSRPGVAPAHQAASAGTCLQHENTKESHMPIRCTDIVCKCAAYPRNAITWEHQLHDHRKLHAVDLARVQ